MYKNKMFKRHEKYIIKLLSDCNYDFYVWYNQDKRDFYINLSIKLNFNPFKKHDR